MKNWCGYIDMLGTRSMARRSSQDLLLGLDSFHTALEDSFKHFTHGKCIAFSDGAFFIAKDIESFHVFFKLVRNQLFQSGIYFRCSLLHGDIIIRERELIHKSKSKSRLPDFFSLTFEKDAPKAYQKESEFKGVGCYIVDSLTDYSFESKNIVTSFFLQKEDSRTHIKKYRDFRYSALEISDSAEQIRGEYNVFDKLVESCHAALAESDSFSSYYLSSIVAILRSTDLRMIDYDRDGNLINAPYAFREFISDGLIKAIRGLPGLNLFLLAVFDHLFEQKEEAIPPRLELTVVTKMLKIPGCFKNLDQIPDFVIKPSAKHRLIEIKVLLFRGKNR